MGESEPIENDSFNPNHLLDTLIERFQLKNDAALARLLALAPPVISKIRHSRLSVSASLLIQIHERTKISIRVLRKLMGDRRKQYRMSVSLGNPVVVGAEQR